MATAYRWCLIPHNDTGRISPSGSSKWRGSFLNSTPSAGKLAFLNIVVGVFESEIGAEGNVTEKVWEWK